MTLAIDIGTLAVEVAIESGSLEPGSRPGAEPTTTIPAPVGGIREAIRAALAAVRIPGGRLPGPACFPGPVCVTVPEAWLSGDVVGAGWQEAVRHECEDVAGTGRVVWAGQLAAVAALVARERGRGGRYLVCDLGGSGVRTGLIAVSGLAASSGLTGPSGLSDSSAPADSSAPRDSFTSGLTVEVLAHHAADGGGWRDFDAAVRAGLTAGEAAALPEDWGRQAASGKRGRRAALVLADALAEPGEFGDTRVYTVTGPRGDISLTARQLIDGFAATLRSLKTAIEAVTGTAASGADAPGAAEPDAVVLTGGLGWLPLAARAVTDLTGKGLTGGNLTGKGLTGTGLTGTGLTGAVPEVSDAGAAARGGLLFASGAALLAPPARCPAVIVPASRVQDGLLQEVDVPLPWTEPFAPMPSGALTIEAERLDLAIDGQPRVASLPGLEPGPHRVGVRPAWPGPGVLVVRSVDASGVHVIPLAELL